MKPFAFAFIVLLGLLLAGCVQGGTPTATPTPAQSASSSPALTTTPTPSPLAYAVQTTGSCGDKPSNQSIAFTNPLDFTILITEPSGAICRHYGFESAATSADGSLTIVIKPLVQTELCVQCVGTITTNVSGSLPAPTSRITVFLDESGTLRQMASFKVKA